MTLDIAAIRARHARASETLAPGAMMIAVDDIPSLVDEITYLRACVETIREVAAEIETAAECARITERCGHRLPERGCVPCLQLHRLGIAMLKLGDTGKP